MSVSARITNPDPATVKVRSTGIITRVDEYVVELESQGDDNSYLALQGDAETLRLTLDRARDLLAIEGEKHREVEHAIDEITEARMRDAEQVEAMAGGMVDEPIDGHGF